MEEEKLETQDEELSRRQENKLSRNSWEKTVRRVFENKRPDRSFQEDVDLQTVRARGDMLTHPEIDLTDEERETYLNEYNEALQRLENPKSDKAR